MKKSQETKNNLLASAKTEFFEKGYMQASLRNICKNAGVTTGAMYFFFEDKEDLFAGCFEMLDRELFSNVMRNIPVIYMENMESELCWRAFFLKIWEFMLGNKDKSLAFVRFYYSPYFVKYYAEQHKKLYEPVVDNLRKAFKPEADVWMILNHIFNVMIDFSIKIHNGLTQHNDDYTEHILRVIYASVKQYFIDAEEKGF